MAEEGNSERACDRCRERRVKCDKRQPACLRCEKLGKPCPGYDKKRKFVDEGISLRKKYQTSSNHSEFDSPQLGAQDDLHITPEASSTQFNFISTFSSQRKSANQTTQHGRTSSLQDQNPASIMEDDTSQRDIAPSVNAPDPLLFPDITYQQNPELTVEDLFNDPAFDPGWFDMEPDDFYATADNSCGFIPNIPNIVDEVDKSDLLQSFEAGAPTPMSGFASFPDTSLWAPESQFQTSAIITDEREHEMAYLIRHFTEAIGPWMDLFDQDKHFGNLVPLKALRDALLRNAIAAVSAKQLGRVKGTKPYVGVQSQKPATMEVIDDVPETDWFYKAANYYDKAIASSRIYLQAISGRYSNPPSPDPQATMSTANSDDLLVAVSIFSLYESLDNTEIGWLQHLAGLKTLLSSVTTEDQSELQVTPSVTVGRLASFWNFARADYQAAYINHQRTYLDTEDLNLWRSCGLQIQDDGSIYPDALKIKNDPLHCRQIAEIVSHTLLWLVLRVMNYLASDQDETSTIRQARWLQLTTQLQEWFDHLPQTFQPCAQIRYPLKRLDPTATSHLTELFFSMNVCAAALQLYHFARILLLLNKPIQPQDTPSGGSRLKAYRELSTESIKHAHQIVGIALGRPHPAVRVEMLLPLYIAGLCLEADEERKVLWELLHAIQQDTGCSTEARCLELLKEWGWDQRPEDMLT